jgi:hypothetical protein
VSIPHRSDTPAPARSRAHRQTLLPTRPSHRFKKGGFPPPTGRKRPSPRGYLNEHESRAYPLPFSHLQKYPRGKRRGTRRAGADSPRSTPAKATARKERNRASPPERGLDAPRGRGGQAPRQPSILR